MPRERSERNHAKTNHHKRGKREPKRPENSPDTPKVTLKQ